MRADAVGIAAAMVEVCGTPAATLTAPLKMTWALSWRSPLRIRMQTRCQQKQIGTMRQASKRQPQALGVGDGLSASRTMLALSAMGTRGSGVAGTPSATCGAAARCMPAPAVGIVAASVVVCGTRAAKLQMRLQMSPLTSRPVKMRRGPSWRSPLRIRMETHCRQKQIGTTRQASRQQPPALGVGGRLSASRTTLALSATGTLVSGVAGTPSDT